MNEKQNALGVGPDRVERIVQHFDEEHEVPPSFKQGRPTKCTTDVLT